MGVSKNSGTPKWMVYNGKLFKMDEFLGYHYFRKHQYVNYHCNIYVAAKIAMMNKNSCGSFSSLSGSIIL